MVLHYLVGFSSGAENSKHEIRNSKQIRNSKSKCPKLPLIGARGFVARAILWVLDIWVWVI